MTIRFDPASHTLWVAIRDLLDTTAFPGNVALTPMLRTRAALGRATHQAHQAAQSEAVESYQAEVTVQQEWQVDDYTVHITGRLDGLYEDQGTLVVEEIKSLLVPPEQFTEIALGDYPAYEQQLTLYVHLLQQQQRQPVRGHLVLVNLTDNATKTLVLTPKPRQRKRFILEQVRRILARYTARAYRVAQHRASLAALQFPFRTLRPQQDAMIDQVRATIQAQGCVLLSAPTGIGKTIAALYPALEQALQQGLRIFYLTAKTTQQALAVETLEQLAHHGVRFNAVHLRAKEKSCINSVFYCHESVCDFAREYRAKLERSQLVERLLELPVLSPLAAAHTGHQYRVCPYELSLDVALEADVIVGDYNYVFDPGSYLRRFFQDTPYDDCVLIIDEAHNLPTRGRDYYSPVLQQRRVRQLREYCTGEPAKLFREFEDFFTDVETLFDLLYAEADPEPQVGDIVQVTPPLEFIAALRGRLEQLMAAYTVYRLRRQQAGYQGSGDTIQDFYYTWQRLCDALALGGEEFAYLYHHLPENAQFKVLCKDAARLLRQRLEGFHSVIAMSATLTPFDFYQDVLGLPPERTTSAAFDSPFPAANRKIMVIPDISTAYRDRERDAPATAAIIDTLIAQRTGNYGVFFPSFAYMRQVRGYVQAPRHSVIEQSEGMSEDDRAAVLERLEQLGTDPILLLGVQGGIFAEGVDYRGDMLIGVLIIGPALPRIDREQELIKEYFEAKYGRGFAYAYLYPGMNRVVQSAGRLIRSETDVGIIALLDKRFSYTNYAALFPTHWYRRTPRELITPDYAQATARFWAGHGKR